MLSEDVFRRLSGVETIRLVLGNLESL